MLGSNGPEKSANEKRNNNDTERAAGSPLPSSDLTFPRSTEQRERLLLFDRFVLLQCASHFASSPEALGPTIFDLQESFQKSFEFVQESVERQLCSGDLSKTKGSDQPVYPTVDGIRRIAGQLSTTEAERISLLHSSENSFWIECTRKECEVLTLMVRLLDERGLNSAVGRTQLMAEISGSERTVRNAMKALLRKNLLIHADPELKLYTLPEATFHQVKSLLHADLLGVRLVCSGQNLNPRDLESPSEQTNSSLASVLRAGYLERAVLDSVALTVVESPLRQGATFAELNGELGGRAGSLHPRVGNLVELGLVEECCGQLYPTPRGLEIISPNMPVEHRSVLSRLLKPDARFWLEATREEQEMVALFVKWHLVQGQDSIVSDAYILRSMSTMAADTRLLMLDLKTRGFLTGEATSPRGHKLVPRVFSTLEGILDLRSFAEPDEILHGQSLTRSPYAQAFTPIVGEPGDPLRRDDKLWHSCTSLEKQLLVVFARWHQQNGDTTLARTKDLLDVLSGPTHANREAKWGLIEKGYLTPDQPHSRGHRLTGEVLNHLREIVDPTILEKPLQPGIGRSISKSVFAYARAAIRSFLESDGRNSLSPQQVGEEIGVSLARGYQLQAELEHRGFLIPSDQMVVTRAVPTAKGIEFFEGSERDDTGSKGIDWAVQSGSHLVIWQDSELAEVLKSVYRGEKAYGHEHGVRFGELGSLCALTGGRLQRAIRYASHHDLLEVFTPPKEERTRYRLTPKGAKLYAEFEELNSETLSSELHPAARDLLRVLQGERTIEESNQDRIELSIDRCAERLGLSLEATLRVSTELHIKGLMEISEADGAVSLTKLGQRVCRELEDGKELSGAKLSVPVRLSELRSWVSGLRGGLTTLRSIASTPSSAPGLSLLDVAEKAGLSRAGAWNLINRLSRRGCVSVPGVRGTAPNPRYRITELGMRVLDKQYKDGYVDSSHAKHWLERDPFANRILRIVSSSYAIGAPATVIGLEKTTGRSKSSIRQVIAGLYDLQLLQQHGRNSLHPTPLGMNLSLLVDPS